jgi:hypothetical protein
MMDPLPSPPPLRGRGGVALGQTFPSIADGAKLWPKNAEGSPRAARVEEANQDGI